MDTCMHKTMASVASLEKIEIIRSKEFMPSKVRLKFSKKMIILGPKTAILGPQFCRILVLGPHFWWSGGAWAPGPPLDPPLRLLFVRNITITSTLCMSRTNQSSSSHRCQYRHQQHPLEFNALSTETSGEHFL